MSGRMPHLLLEHLGRDLAMALLADKAGRAAAVEAGVVMGSGAA